MKDPSVQPSVAIIGTGSAHPRMAFTSDSFKTRYGQTAAAQADASGVVRRFYCDTETQIDLACSAAHGAMQSAGIEASDIDLVISASAVPYQTLPSTAPLIMQRLGLADGCAAGFDVNSTCLSFLTALEVATHSIQSRQSTTVLVVSAEIASRALPWDNDPATAALFGDGAGAVILRTTQTSNGLRAALMRTYPSAYDACSIPAGGTRIDFHADPESFAQNAWFKMDGRELFRLSSRHFKGFVADLLAKADWSLEDVDIIVPHQASPAGLAHMIRHVGVAPEKVVNIVSEYGNQIAASIPFSLDFAARAGRIPAGSKVLFLGTSAGVSIGGVAWET